MTGCSGSEVAEEDLIILGSRVVEMADRLKVMASACPGTAASWAFEMEGQRFKLSMTLDHQEKAEKL